ARDRPRVAWVPGGARAAGTGMALIVGGKRGDRDPADVLQAEWFDPATRRFSLGPNLHTGRMAHTLSPLPDGSLLAAGGWSESSRGTTPTCERFVPDPGSPEGGLFVPAASLGNSRLDAAALTLPDGAVLVVGGVKREGK